MSVAGRSRGCTPKQAQLIRRLVRSHVVEESERRAILARLDAGELTKQRARAGVDWLLRTIAERKRDERQTAG